MKAKIENLYLIDISLIDKKIEELEKLKYSNLRVDLDLLKELKKQLISANILADVCYTQGLEDGQNYCNSSAGIHEDDERKDAFLKSEIEL